MSTELNATRAFSGARCPGRIAVMLAAVLLLGPPRWSSAATPKPRTFPSAPDASDALFQAVRNDDRPALEAILRSTGGLTSCGDESRDARERQRFVEKYQE